VGLASATSEGVSASVDKLTADKPTACRLREASSLVRGGGVDTSDRGRPSTQSERARTQGHSLGSLGSSLGGGEAVGHATRIVVADATPVEGWMEYESYLGWTRRWARLVPASGQVTLHADETTHTVDDSVNLKDTVVSPPKTERKGHFAIRVQQRPPMRGEPSDGPLKRILGVETEEDRKRWMAALTKETGRYAPVKSGWVEKEGHVFKSWKRRWFELKEHDLLYFENDKHDTPASGRVPLLGCEVEWTDFSSNFTIVTRHGSSGNERLVCRAQSGEEAAAWAAALSNASSIRSSFRP